MKKPYHEIDLINFQKMFKTERQCEKRLFKIRWPNGFKCTRCGDTKHFSLPKHKLFQSKKCTYQVSLTADTIMHGTRKPLLKWFWAIYLVNTDKKRFLCLDPFEKIEYELLGSFDNVAEDTQSYE